jgi:hypothetical protein
MLTVSKASQATASALITDAGAAEALTRAAGTHVPAHARDRAAKAMSRKAT